jgi:cytochrome c-type biogenesis protein CcmH/NrfF
MRAVATFVLALALAAPALAAEPRTTLPDIEDEVMCVQCGTPLGLSNAPVAEREREFIRREIARGKTKEEIKDGLVDRFGPAVLAQPDDEGFGLTAYVVPPVLAVLALAAIILLARRWRRRPRRADAAPEELDATDARRLDRDLAAFDN